jgi:hypothetical protein
MKIVEFQVTDCKADRYHYECSDIGDCGGLYYSTSEATERIKVLEEENGNMDSMYQDRMLDLEAKLHKHYEKRIDKIDACTSKCVRNEQQLVERIKVLEDALECIRDGEIFQNKLYPSDIARAALEVKP